jgi:hypothetical protein
MDFYLGTSADAAELAGSVLLTGDTFVPAVRTTAFTATATTIP